MRLILSIFLSCFTISTYSQAVTKVLVIDTIVGDASNFRVAAVKPVDSEELDYFEKSVKPEIILTHFPNLVLPVYGRSAHSRLQIPLDDSGGYLELENVFLLKCDTIRISKLNIFHNCLPDSTSYSLSWYKKYQSDTGSRLVMLSNEKKTGVIDKNCTIKYPDTIKMEVNGVKRDLIMKTSRKNFIICEFSIFHGFAAKGGKRQERRKYRNKSYKYFVVSRDRCKLVLTAKVSF